MKAWLKIWKKKFDGDGGEGQKKILTDSLSICKIVGMGTYLKGGYRVFI